MRRRGFFLLTGLLISLLIITGCGNNTGNTKDAANPVHVAKVQQGQLTDGAGFSGKLEAVESANVAPKIAGKVAGVAVDIGSQVAAGDLLVSLDAQDLAAAVAQAQAGVNSSQAAVGTAQAAIAGARAGIAEAQAKLQVDQVSYNTAKADYDRGQALLQAGALSQSDFDNNYDKPYKSAAAALTADQAAIQAAQAATAQTEEAANQAQAGVAQAQAGLQAAQVTYDESRITSPIDGVVTAKNVNPGEMASPSAAVVTVVNLDKLVVKASINDDTVNKLHTGETLQVKISAVSDKPFTGTVTNISDAADPSTKAFPIKVTLDNKNHVLKPGMFAEVLIPGDGPVSLLVPRKAVVSSGSNSYVYVVENGVARKRTVKVGNSDGINTIVTSGLKEGETVITSGQDSLQDGAKVSVQSN